MSLYLDHPLVQTWLHGVRDRGVGHGSELVDVLGSPHGNRPGMADNVYFAERALKEAVAAGLLTQAKHPSPTVSQSFFAVGGRDKSGRRFPETYSVTEFEFWPGRGLA